MKKAKLKKTKINKSPNYMIEIKIKIGVPTDFQLQCISDIVGTMLNLIKSHYKQVNLSGTISFFKDNIVFQKLKQ